MGRIQSNVGLITGVPIQDTVESLLKLSARPRDLLVSRTKGLTDQQVAVNSLTAMMVSIQLAAKNLSQSNAFTDRTVVSSAPNLLTVGKSGVPAPGNYLFTPVRQAQAHQVLSNAFEDQNSAIGEGELSLRMGGLIDQGILLSELNGGSGIPRGKIRISDRSGESEIIDLQNALTIDDVVDAINSADTIHVRASLEGDSIRLTDLTGESSANLRVQEVGAGGTAAGLGLFSINVAGSTALGADVVRLSAATRLSQLNDGNGVRLRPGVADLVIEFHDGSEPLTVDFGDSAGTEPTLGDLLGVLNDADPSRLSAAISADGDRIELTDKTAGTDDFTVRSLFGGSVAEGLGLAGSTANASLEGGRLRAGLKTTLLSTLGGGQGLDELGGIRITDRSGAVAVVDLGGSETLDDLLSRINASGVGVSARVNRARNGIELLDTTGSTAGHLIIENSDATNSADALGIAVDAAVDSIDSRSLNRQVISEQTLLSKYRNGQPVRGGSFLITDTDSRVAAVNLALIQPKTVGDLLDAINGLGLGLTARINEQGDGIALVDTTGGGGKITVRDSGAGLAATDLGLVGESDQVLIDGTLTEALVGSTTSRITIDSDDSLTTIVEKINALDIGVTASLFREGGATPYRISLVSKTGGMAGEMLVDGADTNLVFTENIAARDAILVVGGSSTQAGLLVTSNSNTFTDLVDGLSVTIAGASTDPVSVTVESSSKTLSTSFKLFVDKYNETITKLREMTKYDPDANTTGVLFGTTEALRVDSALGRLTSDRFLGAGKFRSLAELGIDLRDDGKLDYDETTLKAAFESDPDTLREFFTTPDAGFADRLNKVIDGLAGVGNSLLVLRSNTLQRRIELNSARIDAMTKSLDRQRENMLNKFYQLENTIARMQSNLNSLGNIQALAPLVSRSSR